MNNFALISESINLLEERRKPRKKPAFYYNRLKNQERDLRLKYKKSLEDERAERDSKAKFAKKIKNQRAKAKLDQIRLQMITKKKIKNMKHV